MDPDVSVVVPVFNPGPNIDGCVASLLDQTMDPERYEIILVDDGSTDGTATRLDAIGLAHPARIRIEHTPNSGWPSRPRNIGIGLARGRYVQLVDNDDALAPDALRRLVEVADESDADIVIGRFASNFRGLNHTLFRETVTRRTIADFPLEYSLTPHKMFRREFLNTHDLRFVEGIRHLEDQIFCMQAYVRAESVALVADTLCYHYLERRGPGRNAGTRRIEPDPYYGALELVFDVIDSQVASPELRLRLYRRFYRDEMLRRLREDKVLGYEVDYLTEMHDRILDVALRRVPRELHATLPALVRTQSRLLLNANIDGLLEYSEQLVDLDLVTTCEAPQWVDGRLHLRAEGWLAQGDQPFQLEPHGTEWALPQSIAPTVAVEDRLLLDSTGEPDTELSLVSRIDGASWSTGAAIELTIHPDGSVHVAVDAVVDPDHALGGRRLTSGLWDLKLRVEFAGLSRTATLTSTVSADSTPPQLAAWLSAGGSIEPYWTKPTRRLALDVDEWLRPLATKLIEPAASEPRRAGRTLLLEAPLLCGPSGSTIAAECVVQPCEPAEPPTHLPAVLRLAPTGGVVEVAMRGPAARTEGDQQVWLRLGPAGATAPIQVSPASDGSADA